MKTSHHLNERSADKTIAPTSTTKLIPVTVWAERHAWPPIGGLRHLIFFAESNGFNRVVKRVGRRVLIDEAAFFEWVSQQDGKASPLSRKNSGTTENA